MKPFRDIDLQHLTDDGYNQCCHMLGEFVDVFDVPGRAFGCVVGGLYEPEVRGPPAS